MLYTAPISVKVVSTLRQLSSHSKNMSKWMMVRGIGVDIVRIARFREILKRRPSREQRICQRILHPEEQSKVTAESVVQSLASAWAAKEALYKSLNRNEQKHCRFNKWRKAWVDGQLRLVSDDLRDDTVLLTLSHDGEYTVAMVVRN